MNGRRNFIKGFGLLSAICASSTAARAASATTTLGSTDVSNGNSGITREAIDHLAPSSNTNLTLMANNLSGQAQNAVQLSVGKDNRLWAKVDNQWRRVALES